MNHIDRARQEAAAILKIPPDAVVANDLTETVPWVRKHALVAAGDADSIFTFAVEESGKFLTFRDRDDLRPINRFFETENIRLPDGLPPEHFAGALRLLLGGPGGFVATPGFLEAERQDLASWLRPPVDESEKIFKAHVIPPSLETGSERWRLSFHFFNRRGAVERWIIAGNGNTIGSAGCELALPEWTFRHPYV